MESCEGAMLAQLGGIRQHAPARREWEFLHRDRCDDRRLHATQMTVRVVQVTINGAKRLDNALRPVRASVRLVDLLAKLSDGR